MCVSLGLMKSIRTPGQIIFASDDPTDCRLCAAVLNAETNCTDYRVTAGTETLFAVRWLAEPPIAREYLPETQRLVRELADGTIAARVDMPSRWVLR